MAKLIAGAKPWQIVIIALGALGAVGGVVYFSMSQDPVDLKHEITLGDVSTGELFTASTADRSAVIPEINPATKTATLVRVRKGSDGKWMVVPNDREAVDESIKKSAVEGDEFKPQGEPKRLQLGK